MSLIDPRNGSAPVEQDSSTGSLQWNQDSAAQSPPVTQLPFPGQEAQSQGVAPGLRSQFRPSPQATRVLSNPTTDPGVGGFQFVAPSTTDPGAMNASPHPEETDPAAQPSVTRALPELHTGMLLPISRNATSALRQPVVIRGSGKKSTGVMAPPKPSGGTHRRLAIHLTVTGFLIFMVMVSLLAVIPAGNNDGSLLYKMMNSAMNSSNSTSKNTANILSQAATATAVTQDGYDPGSCSNCGIPPAPPGSTDGGLGRFFYGQCTYWANMRYHQLTGHWVTWLGNANQWVSGAANNGWIVSNTPKVYSIIVLQAGVQGAGWYGHVAVVEKINSDGSVLTTNFNWQGNWAVETYVVFRPGSGVAFLWARGT